MAAPKKSSFKKKKANNMKKRIWLFQKNRKFSKYNNLQFKETFLSIHEFKKLF